jgi:hypothetical protein
VIPAKIEKEAFISLIKQGNLSNVATDVKVDNSFQSFVVSFALLLHLEVIIQQEGAASYYGKSIQGHDIAAYVKTKDSIGHVEIRSTDESLGRNLINEVSNFFPKP